MTEMILAGVFVFFMRLTDMSLDTIRLLFTIRGRKWLSGLIGAAQATVFILAVSKVLSGPLNPFTVIGYAVSTIAKPFLYIANAESIHKDVVRRHALVRHAGNPPFDLNDLAVHRHEDLFWV